jgi:hypothetical protein
MGAGYDANVAQIPNGQELRITMASITDAQLRVTTRRPQDQASVVVSCNIAFTEVEVNAMNLLGLQYTLHCQVLNKDLLDEDPVVSYGQRTFPRVAGEARPYEHAVFDDYVPMEFLHERLIGKDKLVAEIKLRNEETGTEEVQRTDVVDVDLAA